MPPDPTPHARLDRRLERSIEDLPLRVLRAVMDHSRSARELGQELDEPPDLILTHLVDLWEDGCVEAVPGLPPNDPIDRRYRVLSCFFDEPDWSALSKADRESLTATALQGIFTEVLVSMKAATFDERTDRHLSWSSLRLDREGWRELTAVLRRALSEVEAVGERSSERLARSDDEVIEAGIGLLGFERGKSPPPGF
jgi:hypothetical protein